MEDWFSNADSVPQWRDAALTTQNWLTLSAAELEQVGAELMEVLPRWRTREVPDDGAEREPVIVSARGFPSQP